MRKKYKYAYMIFLHSCKWREACWGKKQRVKYIELLPLEMEEKENIKGG